MRLVALTVPVDQAELAADRLWSIGAQAVEERPAAAGHVELRTSLGPDEEIATRRFGALPHGWRLAFVDVDERPAATWREFAVPIVVSERLTIRPAWVVSESVPGVLDIAIEPAGSFGLGDHPTTRLSAAAVDLNVQPGDRMLDVGCGSGVLAIVAARRGAGLVVAIDIADAARAATIANADANGVALHEVSTRPVTAVTGEFDLIAANILAPALVAMAADLRRLTAPNGRLVISGVLADAHAHVLAALAPMTVVDRVDLDGWSAIVLAHQVADR